MTKQDAKQISRPGRDPITWSFTPPQGLLPTTHKFSILDSVEVASTRLDTDYITENEEIVCGRIIRSIFASLPQLIERRTAEGFMPVHKGLAWMGTLGSRMVLYDRSPKMDDKIVVRNSRGEVNIHLKDIPADRL